MPPGDSIKKFKVRLIIRLFSDDDEPSSIIPHPTGGEGIEKDSFFVFLKLTIIPKAICSLFLERSPIRIKRVDARMSLGPLLLRHHYDPEKIVGQDGLDA